MLYAVQFGERAPVNILSFEDAKCFAYTNIEEYATHQLNSLKEILNKQQANEKDFGCIDLVVFGNITLRITPTEILERSDNVFKIKEIEGK